MIIRYLEADRPLPDKYRFLLIEMERLRQWCEDVNRAQSDVEYDYVYVNQESFDEYKPSSFRQLHEGFTEYKV